MCGIVFARTTKGRASKLAFRRYQEQKKRGNEGYGCVCASNRVVNNIYRSEDEDGIRGMLGNKGGMALFHHRKPTSTPNFEECTHPVLVSNELLEYDYYVVHNGMISNAKELKEKFNKLGFEFTTEIEEAYKTKGKTYVTKSIKFNDSECLAIDLAIAIEEGRKQLECRGSIAFVAMQVNKTTKVVENIFYGRNMSNPLVVQDKDGNLIIASEGAGEVVPTHELFCYDTATKKTTSSTLDIGLNYTPSTTPTHTHRTFGDAIDPNPKPAVQGSFLDNMTMPKRLSGRSGDTPIINSVLEKIGFNGHRHRHHATHDIMRSRAAKHEQHMTRKERKRLKYGVEEKEVMIQGRFGQIEDVKYILKGECLLHTQIYKDDVVQSMLGHHWEWYLRLIKEKKDMETILHKNRKVKDYDKEPIVKQLKNISIQFECLSDAVNKIAERDIQNRIILDEANEIMDDYKKDALKNGWERLPDGSGYVHRHNDDMEE